MRFLVDNQLPLAQARWLCDAGHDAVHVLARELDEASDTTLWGIAARENRIIVTKDDDFFHLVTRRGAPPQVVWVRVGNCRTHRLLEVFEQLLPRLIVRLEAGDELVEVR